VCVYSDGGKQLILTKGDNNHVDDRSLYNPGQIWIHRDDIVGRAKAYAHTERQTERHRDTETWTERERESQTTLSTVVEGGWDQVRAIRGHADHSDERLPLVQVCVIGQPRPVCDPHPRMNRAKSVLYTTLCASRVAGAVRR
jgi:hypothetical protein